MNLINNFYSEKDIMQFIKTSIPSTNSNLRLCKGEEDAGWVKFYFKDNKSEFEVLVTLAAYDLTELLIFLENIINLKEETAVFLENETISEPLLFVSPIDNLKIRFLVADGKRVHDLWKQDKISDEELDSKGIYDYDIRCDVIIEKKTLLKEFYRAIKNIINTCTIYENQIYDINYINWKNNLKNIISYTK